MKSFSPMSQWSIIWQLSRVPVFRDAVWYKILSLLLEGGIYPNVSTIFFSFITCWKSEGYKFSDPYVTEKNMLRMRHLFFKAFISSANYERKIMKVKLWKRKVITKILAHIHPFNSRFTFSHQVTWLGTEALQSYQNLDHSPLPNKYFIYQ